MSIYSSSRLTVILALINMSLFGGDMRIYVVDEVGSPIEGAAITVSWNLPRGVRNGWGAGETVRVHAVTKVDGACSVSSDATEFGVHARASGYYWSSKHFSSKEDKKISLMKIHKQVPMIVRAVEDLVIPDAKIIEFDMVVGDWVTPLGKGVQADFSLTRKVDYNNASDYLFSVNMDFQGKGSGMILMKNNARLIECQYRLLREAPESEYVATWAKTGGVKNGSMMYSISDESNNYIFRVRPIIDSEGRVVSALHGKIHGDLLIKSAIVDKSGTVNLSLSFLYYLNPSRGEKSLEWDMVNNLSADVSSTVPLEP
jgi:hypothetical protein